MYSSSEILSRLHRVVAALVILALLTLPVLAVGRDINFVGSRKSNKYHYLDCYWAKRIKPENARYFESVKEARDAGYVPCKVCRPPWQ